MDGRGCYRVTPCVRGTFLPTRRECVRRNVPLTWDPALIQSGNGIIEGEAPREGRANTDEPSGGPYQSTDAVPGAPKTRPSDTKRRKRGHDVTWSDSVQPNSDQMTKRCQFARKMSLGRVRAASRSLGGGAKPDQVTRRTQNGNRMSLGRNRPYSNPTK